MCLTPNKKSQEKKILGRQMKKARKYGDLGIRSIIIDLDTPRNHVGSYALR